ncbi:hypothetical protein DFH11DRAFT_1740234 [Phellopilus nigrolimitatus]|nr:hypothetical protein DFH11DRAFT_1740234 [Phellopilus nigrolimitatus]
MLCGQSSACQLPGCTQCWIRGPQLFATSASWQICLCAALHRPIFYIRRIPAAFLASTYPDSTMPETSTPADFNMQRNSLLLDASRYKGAITNDDINWVLEACRRILAGPRETHLEKGKQQVAIAQCTLELAKEEVELAHEDLLLLDKDTRVKEAENGQKHMYFLLKFWEDFVKKIDRFKGEPTFPYGPARYDNKVTDTEIAEATADPTGCHNECIGQARDLLNQATIRVSQMNRSLRRICAAKQGDPQVSRKPRTELRLKFMEDNSRNVSQLEQLK